MRANRRRRSTWIALAAAWALGACLLACTAGPERALRTVLLDAFSPPRALVLDGYERLRAGSRFDRRVESSNNRDVVDAGPEPHRAELHRAELHRAELHRAELHRAELHRAELRCRQLLIENARLRDELKLAEKYGVSPLPVSSAPVAAFPGALRAGIIRGDAWNLWQSVRHLDRGSVEGIAEEAAVLEEDALRVDRGADAGIEPEFDVYVGRTLVGRIASVGHWTSTLQLVTDARYRALAQIVRPSEKGGAFGAEGILAGQGTALCKLTDVSTTETVRVGDEVYTSDRDRRTPVPLYYGRIVRVEEAGGHWDITVEPAAQVADLRTVAVMARTPNPVRTSAE